jgi:hypothetical protein
MFVLMLAGIILVVAGATFAVRHPRSAGEPFSQVRKLYLAVSIAGAVLIAFYAASVSAPP